MDLLKSNLGPSYRSQRTAGNLGTSVPNRQQFPADDPFLDLPRDFQTNNQNPNVGWQPNLDESQYLAPASPMNPELTAPRLIAPRPNPQTSPQADFAPKLPSWTMPESNVQPQYVQPNQTQPQQSPQQFFQPQPREPQFAPNDPRNFEPDPYVCPYAAARRARASQFSAGYQPQPRYVPYGGRGLDREFQGRPPYSRPGYSAVELEVILRELYRARYRVGPPAYGPYGGRR